MNLLINKKNSYAKLNSWFSCDINKTSLKIKKRQKQTSCVMGLKLLFYPKIMYK